MPTPSIKKHKFRKIGLKAGTPVKGGSSAGPATTAAPGDAAPAVAGSETPAGTEADGTVKVGAQVCVCTDRDRLTCGRVGQVQQILAETVTVETSTLQVLQAARAEVRLLSDFGQPLQAKQAYRMTNEQKLQMLMQCGWDDDREQDDTFDAMQAVLKGTTPILLGVDHLKTWSCYQAWALNVEAIGRPVEFLAGDLLRAWYVGLSDSKENPEHLEKLRVTWTRQCAVKDSLAFLPVWSEVHWTLLVIDHTLQECRYYDSLKDMQTSNWLYADALLSELKKAKVLPWLPAKCPDKANYCVQGPLECGFYACWFMEEEIRRAHGERPFRRGVPQILGKGGERERLCSIFHTLEAANRKMLEDQKLMDMRSKLQ